MKRIIMGLVGLSALASIVVATAPVPGEAAPIYGIKAPKDTVTGTCSQSSDGPAQAGPLGNDIAIEAFRTGKLPFPDGAIIAALHWNEDSSTADNKVLADGFPGLGLSSTFAGSAVNVQFMVKDSKKYAASGGWGFADFTNGKPG